MKVVGHLLVAGYCPMGCGETLFVREGEDGPAKITCAGDGCPDPERVAQLLADPETEHVVVFGESSFNLQHPLREHRDELFDCTLHQELSGLDGPPMALGRYRVVVGEDGAFQFTPLGGS